MRARERVRAHVLYVRVCVGVDSVISLIVQIFFFLFVEALVIMFLSKSFAKEYQQLPLSAGVGGHKAGVRGWRPVVAPPSTSGRPRTPLHCRQVAGQGTWVHGLRAEPYHHCHDTPCVRPCP